MITRLLLTACLSIGGGALAYAGKIQTKPVICGDQDETFSTLRTFKQQKIYQATQLTTVKESDGFSDTPVLLPMAIFMNLDEGTYTVVEYHPAYNQYCLVSFGREGEFVNE
tara:strand:- start:884 stop:1216 length:333 start_codon:yes stop_codon:yes gene_type:complete